ncbi:hypothetical protein [Nocardiopsis alborubida]|uniref:Uncharacterized protein n=1 Tax=Nocardiopsis alborubida TaxID=146802 RepID=A0A7X6RTQ8_9ACTN|nr:hypothetical protein [Nocardiopsis alborubida]NKZ01663.1 hypothetical protein [Nocardiopsis alborubida]
MAGEAGANPIEAMKGGELAETLADAMAGIADMYDFLLDEARSKTSNPDIANGFNLFKNSTHQSFLDVQNHGLQLANNIQSGAGSIAQEDWKSAENFSDTWSSHRDINFD